jgi:hypothetical protein
LNWCAVIAKQEEGYAPEAIGEPHGRDPAGTANRGGLDVLCLLDELLFGHSALPVVQGTSEARIRPLCKSCRGLELKADGDVGAVTIRTRPRR